MGTTMRVGVAMALGAAALLTGCGDSGGGGDDFAKQSADDIIAAVKKDMGELETMRIAGSLTDSGQKVELDLRMSKDGDCSGSVDSAGTAAELRSVDGKSWVKSSESGEKWIALGGELPFGEICDIDKFLETVDVGKATFAKDGTDTVDGDEVVKLTMTDKEDGTTHVSVLSDSPHYIVVIENNESDSPGSMTFSEFDKDFTVEAPADDEVVDLGSLG